MPFSANVATEQDWERIAEAQGGHRCREAQQMLALLESLRFIKDGFPVDQLEHSLQTATRAMQAGARTEMIVAALLHDVGKAYDLINHPEIGAAMLRRRVSDNTYEALLHHGEFLADYAHGTALCGRFKDEPWYQDAADLASWDEASFDEAYDSCGIDYFAAMVFALFTEPVD